MKPRKSPAEQREQPDLPAEWESGSATDLLPANGAIDLEGRHLHDAACTNGKAAALRLEGCLLERVRFTGSEFSSVTWKDVRLVGCDLANVRAHRLNLVRVELIDCRFTGFATRAADCRDVLFQDSDLRFAQLYGALFRRCEFASTDLTEADLREADLSGVLLRGCRLTRADLRQARLREADLRQSDLEQMLVGIADLDGAIVDPAQAMVLARLMGLQIR